MPETLKIKESELQILIGRQARRMRVLRQELAQVQYAILEAEAAISRARRTQFHPQAEEVTQ